VKHQAKVDEMSHVPVDFWYDNLRQPRIMNKTPINDESIDAEDMP